MHQLVWEVNIKGQKERILRLVGLEEKITFCIFALFLQAARFFADNSDQHQLILFCMFCKNDATSREAKRLKVTEMKASTDS